MTFWIKFALIAGVLLAAFGAGFKTAATYYKVRELKAELAGKDATINDLKLANETSILLSDMKDGLDRAASAAIDAIQGAADAAEAEDRAIPVDKRVCRDYSPAELERLRQRVLAQPRAASKSGHSRSKP